MQLESYPLCRKENIVVQELMDEMLIYDIGKNRALCLNQTSAMIWNECDGTKSVTEISSILGKKVKANISEDIIWLALNQFKKDNLLVESNDFITPLDGLNRREIVKRIGFASMIALPVVASVLAPTAVAAQSVSGCGCFAPNNLANLSNPGCACAASMDCCLGSCAQGTCEADGILAGPGCCPGSILCPPQNQTNIPPGCGCNPPNGGECASGNCVSFVCRL